VQLNQAKLLEILRGVIAYEAGNLQSVSSAKNAISMSPLQRVLTLPRSLNNRAEYYMVDIACILLQKQAGYRGHVVAYNQGERI
jgi:hypothetical protein